MEVITDVFSFDCSRPIKYVQTMSPFNKKLAMFCCDNKVILTDRYNYNNVYMVCDAELFIMLTGVEFSLGKKKTKRYCRKVK